MIQLRVIGTIEEVGLKMLQFDTNLEKSAVIKVVGVGGGGYNLYLNALFRLVLFGKLLVNRGGFGLEVEEVYRS